MRSLQRVKIYKFSVPKKPTHTQLNGELLGQEAEHAEEAQRVPGEQSKPTPLAAKRPNLKSVSIHTDSIVLFCL